MKIIFSFILALFAVSTVFAQKGVVTVVKDPMIDSLIAKRLKANAVNGVVNANKPVVSDFGYRVQVFYGSDRREVFSQQSRFKSLYPRYNTYISYKEPNYYIRVGDFRTRLEAQQFMAEIRTAFPTLFIFKEKINAPRLDSTSNDQR